MSSLQQLKSDLRQAFAVFDNKNLGYISVWTFQTLLTKCGSLRLTEKEASVLIERLDRRKDGRIILAELEELLYPEEIVMEKDNKGVLPMYDELLKGHIILTILWLGPERVCTYSHKMPEVFVAVCLEAFRKLATSCLPGESIKELLIVQNSEMHGLNRYEVPALEDEEFASKIEILYADLPVFARYRHKLTGLKWGHTAWNGVDILMRSLEPNEPPPKFQLTKTLGRANASLITEYVLGYITAIQRSFFKAKEYQTRHDWAQKDFTYSHSLSNKTFGILGVGAIGKHMAKIFKTLGMTIWGLTRRPPSQENRCPYIDVYKTTDDLPELLQNCDYFCNLLPSTPGTVDLLSGDILSNCKTKRGVFINVGRGDIVNEESLVKALKNKWLGGVVLDVYVNEPIPPESPIWDLPGVFITPHVSGWSNDESHARRINECFIKNYHHYINGEPLEGVLDWNQGY